MAEPDEYHKSTTIKLYFNSKTDCSIDEAGAIKYSKSKTKAKANTHGTWVQQAQKDLIALGYLAAKGSDGNPNDDGYFGPGTKRAVTRFQRHAARVYRMDSAKAVQDVKPAEVFAGKETGEVDPATAKEMRKWIDKKWVNPVGRFKITKFGTAGKLREDAAEAWKKIVEAVEKAGGTLAEPYGDTLRGLKPTSKGGTSGYSFHYTGRAVDIQQALGGGKGQRYFMVKEPSGTQMFWRLYCKTDKQDGTQGTEFKKGDKKYWVPSMEKEADIPKGHYIDLTATIESTGTFERIAAQSGWDTHKDKAVRMNKHEWWHFQYKLDKQKTFQDELELIGFTEEQIRKAGWDTDAKLDHAPG
jgi:peptidoglycan hydrolase-like protein with peptidoglycan-binding domain